MGNKAERTTMYKNNSGFSAKFKGKSLETRYYSYTNRYPQAKETKRVLII